MGNKKKILKQNRYNVKKIKDAYLITLDHGSWIVMKKPEFQILLRGKVSPEDMKRYEKEGLVLTEDSIERIGQKYRKRYHFLGNKPSLHIVIPTLRCNMSCTYCHSEAKSADARECDMSIDTADKTVDFIMDVKAKKITIEFQGGEPLMNFPVVRHIVEYSQNKNDSLPEKDKKKIDYVLVTNLTAITDEIIEFIKKNKISVTTSLDGPKEVHDKNRIFFGGEGSYEKVTAAATNMRKEGVGLGMLMTTTKDSLKYPEKIVDEYVKQGMSTIQIKPMNWIGYATSGDRYTAEEFIEFWKRSLDYIVKLNKQGIMIKERITQVLLMKIMTEYDPNFLDIRSPCGAVVGQLLYDQKGDIYTCDDAKIFDIFRIGSVRGEKYPEIVNKPQVKSIIASSINDQYLCDKCVYRPYCGTCPVANYAEHGTPIPKLYNNYKCKIRKAQFDHLFEKIIFDKEYSEVLIGWLEK